MQGVFVDRIAVSVPGERDELDEHALPAHAQLFAKALRGRVVILDIGVEPAKASCPEEVVEQGPCGFERISAATELRIEVPADRGRLVLLPLLRYRRTDRR